MTARRMTLTLTLVALCGSAAADDEGKPIRGVTYGTFVRGVLTGADQDANGSRSDIYRFHGSTGEGVHVAAVTAAPGWRSIRVMPCAWVTRGAADCVRRSPPSGS